MSVKHLTLACALLLVCGVSATAASERWRKGHDRHWRTVHGAIYELDNRIAFLEADPEIDDGYKGPIITRARTNIRALRATLPPADWRWAAPCCYGRRPIHIR